MLDTSVQDATETSAKTNELATLGEAACTQPRSISDRTTWALERGLLKRLLRLLGDIPLAVELWDASVVAADESSAIARLTIRSRSALWRILFDPWYQFGEAYTAGELQLDGDLTEVLTSIYQRRARTPAARRAMTWWWRILHPQNGNTAAASRDNIHHHYDIGNDFYRLWLDERLVYTCAYFAEPTYTLEQAQLAKMEHVCRKLELRPGERVVEAGCGWGALALYMARHHGVSVKAFNISKEQVAYAREQARRQGLEGQVEFCLEDWRDIKHECDAFVSIGMLEHVGRGNYARLAQVIDRCLTRQGRGLLHFIGQNLPQPLNPWIERHIFPGAYGPSLCEALRLFEPFDFSVLDVENLRLHYAETLRHWLLRFRQHSERVRSMFDDRFVRSWELYLAGSEAAFAGGALQLFQVLFARADRNDVPMTRSHLYASPPCEEACGNGQPANSYQPRLPR